MGLNGTGGWSGLVAQILVLGSPEPGRGGLHYRIARSQGHGGQHLPRLVALLATFVVTVVGSLFTRPRPVEELKGLVYGLTELPKDENAPFLHRPIVWAGVVGALLVGLSLYFW